MSGVQLMNCYKSSYRLKQNKPDHTNLYTWPSLVNLHKSCLHANSDDFFRNRTQNNFWCTSNKHCNNIVASGVKLHVTKSENLTQNNT